VIVKESILGKVSRMIPSMLDYKIQASKDSMFNTPPVFAVYTSMLNMRWIEAQGGIEALGIKNGTKATLIYGEIDRNSKFEGFANKEDRSDMNATFNLTDPTLADAFDGLCQAAGISGLKGHRSVGGYRASMYNALPIDSVEILVDCMQTLEKNY
jgi:phosphoserine aminotransferase